MANFSPLNVVKEKSKILARAQGISLSKSKEQIAKDNGFKDIHELQAVAALKKPDPRLMRAAFGHSDLREVTYEDQIYGELYATLDNVLSGEIAETNASMFMIENLEVQSAHYDEHVGKLLIGTAFEYEGEQDPDRPYSGNCLIVEAKLELLIRRGEWRLEDVKIESCYLHDESAWA